MKNILNALLCVSLVLGGFFANAGEKSFEFSKKFLAPFYKADQFLTGLGFKDYSGMAQETYDSDEEIHPVSELVLENNIKLYSSLTASKYLADLGYAFLIANESLPKDRAQKNIDVLIGIASQQIMAFPLLGLEPVKDPKYTVARGKQALEIRIDYLGARAVERNSIEKANLIKAYTYLYNQLESGPNKSVVGFQKWVDKFLTSALRDPYDLVEAQQNRYLGRALVSVLVKYAREKKKPMIEDLLSTQMAHVGVNLQDMITAKYRPLTDDRNQPAFQLKNGDIALEFSNGQDAYYTAMGVKPSTPQDMALAKKYDLINSYSYLPLFLSQEYYDKALDRERSNLVLNDEQERTLRDFWDPAISKGYSHSGIVHVLTDRQSGISLAWIMDIFPLKGIGRVRLMNPEGFGFPEKHIRIGFARYSPQKVLASLKNQIQTRGFLDFVMDSNESFVEQNYLQENRLEPFVNGAKRYKWPAITKKSEVMSWVKNVKPEQAEDWYQNQLLPKVFHRMEEFIYSKDALAFATNLVNARAQAYCSQVIQIAFLQMGNFNVAPSPDQYRALPVYLAKLFPEKAEIDLKEKFIAPNGLVWQDHILESHVSFNFNRDRVARQKASSDSVEFYTHYLEKNPEVSATRILIEPSKMKVSDTFIADDLSL